MTTVGIATAAELVEATVAKQPDTVALMYQDVELSYAGLNTLANRLAWRLISRGIGPDSVVALAVPRSPEMIVAWLGVLKAGAAYLPVDAGYPADRIAFMLGDTRPAVIVTTAEVSAALPVTATEVVLLDDPGGDWPDTNPTDAARTVHSRRTTPRTSSTPPDRPARRRASWSPHTGLAALARAQVDRFGITR